MGGAPKAPASVPEAPAEPAAETTPAPAAGTGNTPDAAALRRLWPEVLDVVKQSSKRARALLENAQIASSAGEKLTLSAPPALVKMIGEQSNTSVLAAALTQIIGGSWQISVEPAASTGGFEVNPAGSPQPPAEEDPRDDEPAEPAASTTAIPADPETEALRLLTDQLGARPVNE